MRDTEREAETQAEGETGSLWGTWCRTRFQDPGITTWAEGRCSTTEPPRSPIFSSSSIILKVSWFISHASDLKTLPKSQNW